MAEELAFDEQVIDRLAAVLKALADPNRLRILAVLAQHEACNCQRMTRNKNVKIEVGGK